MARIQPKEARKYPWYLRLLFRSQTKKYGRPLLPLQLWGRTPRVTFGFLHMLGALYRKRSPLSMPLRALIATRVSQVKHCTFCIDFNSERVIKDSSREKLDALPTFRDSALFTPLEKDTLAYTEAMTENPSAIPDEIFNQLKEHYDDDAICELTALIAFQCLSSNFNSALQIESHGLLCST